MVMTCSSVTFHHRPGLEPPHRLPLRRATSCPAATLNLRFIGADGFIQWQPVRYL